MHSGHGDAAGAHRAAAAAAYLVWLVRPRQALVSAGRTLLFAGLLLHLG